MSAKNAKLYLTQIHESIISIIEYTREMSKDDFCRDSKTIDAVLMQIIVIGECTTKLYATTICEKYPSVPWAKVKGMRDVGYHHLRSGFNVLFGDMHASSRKLTQVEEWYVYFKP